MPAFTTFREVRHDFAYYAAKLETVPRKPGGDAHLRVRGMAVEDKACVGRVGVHASHALKELSVQRWNNPGDRLTHESDFLSMNVTINGFRCAHGGVGGAMEGDFYAAARAINGRQPIGH